MKIVKDLDNSKVIIYDNDKKVLEMGFIFDEFVYTFYTNEPIIIDKV